MHNNIDEWTKHVYSSHPGDVRIKNIRDGVLIFMSTEVSNINAPEFNAANNINRVEIPAYV